MWSRAPGHPGYRAADIRGADARAGFAPSTSSQLLTCSSSTPDWGILQFQAGKKRGNTLLKGECQLSMKRILILTSVIKDSPTHTYCLHPPALPHPMTEIDPDRQETVPRPLGGGGEVMQPTNGQASYPRGKEGRLKEATNRGSLPGTVLVLGAETPQGDLVALSTALPSLVCVQGRMAGGAVAMQEDPGAGPDWEAEESLGQGLEERELAPPPNVSPIFTCPPGVQKCYEQIPP